VSALEDLVTATTNHAAAVYRIIRRMRTFYVFVDKRPGSIEERFDLDAKNHSEYRDLFRGY